MWRGGACWLQESWQTADLWMCGSGVPVGCKSGHKKPLMCGPGVPVGCKRVGKRQTWMPIRSH